MFDRLAHVVDEYDTLEQQLSDPEVLADSDQLRRLSMRYNELGPVVEAYRRRAARRADADAAREMLSGATGEERDMLVD
ncbi:MAG: PCRF domain-containing protein, partial [Acidimicrobiales bacterium]